MVEQVFVLYSASGTLHNGVQERSRIHSVWTNYDNAVIFQDKNPESDKFELVMNAAFVFNNIKEYEDYKGITNKLARTRALAKLTKEEIELLGIKE